MRVASWKASWADLIQVAQVTYDVTGVGLALGGVVGHIQDLFYGTYRKITGEQVRFTHDLPTLNKHELKALQGMAAAANIGSAGQVFDDDTHFLTLATYAASVYLTSSLVEQYDLIEITEDPLSAILDAPRPTDPVTIEVIKSMGLNLEDGIGFPMNEEKQIPMSDWTDYTTQKTQESFRDYVFRHTKDQRGFVISQLVNNAVEDLINATDPGGTVEEKDTPMTTVFLNMIKTPLLPGEGITPEQWQEFEDWVNGWNLQYGEPPKIKDVQKKFELLEMSFRTSYPTEMDPAMKHLWPDPFDDSEYA